MPRHEAKSSCRGLRRRTGRRPTQAGA
jgi:hypothetical protein